MNFAPQKFTDGRLTDEPTRTILASFLAEFEAYIRRMTGGRGDG
ncbi:MAG TPA: hypothetical protein VF006_30780 [Longimicrobium sp.]